MGDKEGQEIEKQEMITYVLVQDTQDSKCYTLSFIVFWSSATSTFFMYFS